MLSLLASLGLALSLAGCSDDDTTTTPTPTSPSTTRFASRVTVGGSASRTFATSKAGNITVRLESASGPVGIGLGLPTGGVSTCTLSTSVVATPQSVPHIAAPVDVGAYCVAAFDPGTFTAPVDFDIVIVYP